MAAFLNSLKRPRLVKGLIIFASLVALWTVIGFLVVPPIAKHYAIKILSETLHRDVTVQKIGFNPFSLSLKLRGIDVSERGSKATWISFGEIYANVELWSLFKRGLVVNEARVQRPYVSIVRKKDGTYNFSDLIDEFTKKPAGEPEPEKEEESEPFRYSINNIRIANGSLDFDDQPVSTRHEVRGIELAIPFVSNMKYMLEQYIQPMFSASVNGRLITMQGRTKLFHESLETSLDINISNVDLPFYLAYVPIKREYEIPSAFLDAKMVLAYTQYKDKLPSLRTEGEIKLRELRVTGNDKSAMLNLPELIAAIAPSELLAQNFRIASIEIKDPAVNVSIDDKGRINLMALAPEGKAASGNPPGDSGKPVENKEEKKPEPKKEKLELSLDSFKLSGGKVVFTDASRKKPFKTTIGRILVEAQNFKLDSPDMADFLVSFLTEANESLEIKGKASNLPPASDGTVTLKQGNLMKYAPFYSDMVRFDVREGKIDLGLGYHYSGAGGKNDVKISGLNLTLSNLRLRQRDERDDFLKIPVLTVKDAEFDLAGNTATVGEISTSQGEIFVRRREDGEINVGELTVTRYVPGGELSRKNAPAAKKKPAPKAAEPSRPFAITIKKIVFDKYTGRFNDRSMDPPVNLSLDRFNFLAENLSTRRGERGKMNLTTIVNKTGSLSLASSFTLEPPSSVVRIKARTIPIAPIQPYFTEKVIILMTGGALSLDGNTTVDAPPGKPVRATFRGELGISNFASVDKEDGEDFLKFESLHLAGIDVKYNPTSVLIKEVSLSDFYSRIILYPDVTLNVQGIIAKEEEPDAGAGAKPKAKPEAKPGEQPPPAEGTAAPAAATAQAGPAPPKEAPAAAPAKETPPVPIQIDIVTLQGGDINFSDRYIKPNYSVSLQEIGGRITGLTSDMNTKADLELRGKFEKTAPMEIRGRINPLAKNLFVDLTVNIKDWDLPPMTPYSGRYMGYVIDKGKLALQLKYLIENRKLKSENKVILDQFTLGEKVESKDAVKLPVKFAVMLLKDRNGVIDLDLPVEGTLDDPKFNVWKVVWQVVKNVLVKAATAPFDLLASLFRGGPDLSYLEFEPGMSAVSGGEMVKLVNLQKALYNRPGLKLEIEGYVDVDRDREGMKQRQFKRKIATLKAAELSKKGENIPDDIETIVIEPAEYPKYVTKVYKDGKFPKPRNAIGLLKELPVSEMEKLILTNLPITDDNLKELAFDRATYAKKQLISGGKVEGERIFVVQPKSLSPERKPKQRDSRADFKLK